MFDFDEALKRVATQTILCVGDVMLDDFVYGDVTRISPEAPTPVLAVRHNAIEIGGAGNVARNIATLGARCVFVGLIGDDDAGRVLIKALAQFDGFDHSRSGRRRGAADHAQGALRLRTSLDPSDAGRLGDGRRRRAPRARRRSSPVPRRRCPRSAPWCCPTTPRAC